MNKKLVSYLSALVLSTAALPSVAANDFDFTPYLGANAQWRSMHFQKKLGDNLVKHSYPQGNVYAGVKFNDFVALELGYDRTATKEHSVILNAGDNQFGTTVGAGPSYAAKTKTSIHGIHTSLVGFLPICDEYHVSLVGSIGLAQLKLKIVHDFNNIYRREFSKKKWIPRANVGIQHLITDDFGVRAMVGWEKTSAFKNLKPVNATSSLRASVKDSITSGLGLFYTFN